MTISACLGLLEEVDALLDPHPELLLGLLPLRQVSFRQHLVHLNNKNVIPFKNFISAPT